jgi:PAS domain S-box-containing protein
MPPATEASGQAQIVAPMVSISRAAAGTAVVVGAVVLTGWTFNLDFLKSLSPNLASMKTNTALSMLLSGVSLWSLSGVSRPNWKSALGYGCAIVMLLIGVLTGSEMAFHWNLGIDQLVFKEVHLAVGTSSPNRMSINTAICITLIGTGLLLLERRIGNQRPSQVIALASGLVSLSAVIGYVFDVHALYSISVFTGMAIHTAITILVLSLGLLLVRSQDGFMSVVSRESPSGTLVRKLLPVALLLPTLGGWVRWEAQKHGLFGTEIGIILFASFNTITLIAFMYTGVVLLNQLIYRVQASEERLQLAVEAAQLGVWDLDLISDRAFRSLRHDQIFGYESLQPEWGLEIAVYHIVPEDRERFRSNFAEALKANEFFTECRINRAADRSLRWICAQGRVYRDLVGKPVRMRGVVADITDRKQAERDLERHRQELSRSNSELAFANKELESFSYSVSHDLRAPLRTIDGFSHALLEDCADRLDSTGKGHLYRIRAATQRMGLLIDDLLNLSRLSRAELRKQNLDLSALARSIAEDLQKTHPERRIELRLEGGLQTSADPGLLRVVLENLLSNAWKFTSKRDSAHIEFGLARGDGTPAFFVRDDGAGFDPAYADRLFGAFQRLHATTEFAGTGVGLATVQRIVHRHGGRIWAESTVDRGATFYFTLSETAS